MPKVAILSLLPEKVRGSDGTGKFLVNILPYLNDDYVILMQDGEPAFKTGHSQAIILQVWNKFGRNRFKNIIPLVKTANIKTVLVNFEYKSFGGFAGLVELLVLIVSLKLIGVRVVGLMHHSLLRFRQYVRLFSLDSTVLHGIVTALTYYPLFWGLHFLMLMLLDSYVVMEQFLKKNLQRGITVVWSKKISVISHPVYEVPRKKSKHTKKWNVSFFGYITRYKGLETLLNAWVPFEHDAWPINVKLNIAGGESATANDHLYFSKILHQINSLKGNFTYYGYITEHQKKHLFNITNLLVLPYAALVATSGPLATAIGSGVPFTVSKTLRPLLQNHDVRTVMKKNGLVENDIVFGKTQLDLSKHLLRVLQDQSLQEKLRSFSGDLEKLRKPKMFISALELELAHKKATGFNLNERRA